MTPSEQRTQALAEANRRRHQVVVMRNQVRAGTVNIADIFRDPPPELHHLALLDVFALSRLAVGRARSATWRQTLGRRALAAQVNLLTPVGISSVRSREWAASQVRPARKPRTDTEAAA